MQNNQALKAELLKFEFKDCQKPILSRDTALEIFRLQEERMIKEVLKDLNKQVKERTITPQLMQITKTVEAERIGDEIYLARSISRKDVMRAFGEYDLENSFEFVCMLEELKLI